MSTTLEREKIEETTLEIDTENGDHDKFSHYYKNSDVAEAVFTGKPAKALCGKLAIPMSATKDLQVCPTCKEIHSLMKD